MERRERVLYLLYLRHRCLKYRYERKQWVHPLLQEREKLGVFHTLYRELRQHNAKFFNYFRMSIPTFDELHNKLKNSLQRQNTKMRNCVCPEEMLTVTIRYIATGCTFTDLHYSFRLGISTVKEIVQTVCTTIWQNLREECMPNLTKQKWENVAAGFEKKSNFPHCIGAVDGKHIRIIKPENSGSMYFNYKDYFSIVLMAVADSEYRFLYVDIGSYGKDCDSAIFKNSSLAKEIKEGKIELPNPRSLPHTNSPDVPYVFVADEAFALNNNLLRPYGGKRLTKAKRIFNYRLSRARRYVECSFGILSNKWRIFHRPFNISAAFVVDVTKACVLLHNFVRERDGLNFEDTLTISGLLELEHGSSVRGNQSANTIRNVFTDYFLSNAGSVPWQNTKI